MAHGIKKGRLLSDICTVGELREVRRELELRTWYAERRLADGVGEIFAPVRGLLQRVTGVLRMFRGKLGCGC